MRVDINIKRFIPEELIYIYFIKGEMVFRVLGPKINRIIHIFEISLFFLRIEK